jgi:hypothetical protein
MRYRVPNDHGAIQRLAKLLHLLVIFIGQDDKRVPRSKKNTRTIYG